MSWLGLEAIQSLAVRVCEDFAKRCPVEYLSTESKEHVARRLHAALGTVESNIVTFLARNPYPGLVKKAVCANKVKWGLIERGYPKDLVSEVTQKVVLGLFRPAKKA